MHAARQKVRRASRKDVDIYRMKRRRRRRRQGGSEAGTRSDSREGQSSERIHPPQRESSIDSLICCLQLSGCHGEM